jgi:tetratricopeptide (TPR) repeat protein
MYQIILLSIISANFTFCQKSIDGMLHFAAKQLEAGNYGLAAKEYQRVMFFTDTVQPDVLINLAEALYKDGNWQQARNYYNQVIRIAENNNQIIESKFNVISSYISENLYNQALVELFNIHDSTYQEYQKDVDILFGICYFGLQNFEESGNYFKYAVKGDERAIAKIDSVFSDKKGLHRPNPKVASVLSIILPGLGQAYSGSFYTAANSFLLTESLLALAIIVAYQYRFIDAIFTVLPWYQRYYLGGVENAEKVAKQKRSENRNHAYKTVLDIVNESVNKSQPD